MRVDIEEEVDCGCHSGRLRRAQRARSSAIARGLSTRTSWRHWRKTWTGTGPTSTAATRSTRCGATSGTNMAPVPPSIPVSPRSDYISIRVSPGSVALPYQPILFQRFCWDIKQIGTAGQKVSRQHHIEWPANPSNDDGALQRHADLAGAARLVWGRPIHRVRLR